MNTPSGKLRAWQRMLSGRRLDLLDPNPADVEIVDIAHGLARVARWNGQTRGEHAFSVAQHALLVEAIASAEAWVEEADGERLRLLRLAALLHDAPEYVVGDLISPFKAAVGYDYKMFELRLLDAIHRRFAVPEELVAAAGEAIKRADHSAAYFEATMLAGFEEEEALIYFGRPEIGALSHSVLVRLVTPWPTGMAQEAFLQRFHTLVAGQDLL